MQLTLTPLQQDASFPLQRSSGRLIPRFFVASFVLKDQDFSETLENTHVSLKMCGFGVKMCGFSLAKLALFQVPLKQRRKSFAGFRNALIKVSIFAVFGSELGRGKAGRKMSPFVRC